jgi:hypothetical protein
MNVSRKILIDWREFYKKYWIFFNVKPPKTEGFPSKKIFNLFFFVLHMRIHFAFIDKAFNILI